MIDSVQLDNTKKLLSLQQAAEKLAVSPETLLNWNEHNILKPTITLNGEIGYTFEQIENFLIIKKLFPQQSKNPTQEISQNQTVPQPQVDKQNLSIDLEINPVSEINSTIKHKKRKTGLQYFLAVSASSFVVFSIAFGLFANTSSATSQSQVLSAKDSSFKEQSSSLDKADSLDSNAYKSPIQIKNKAEISSNLGSDGIPTNKKDVALAGAFEAKGTTAAVSNQATIRQTPNKNTSDIPPAMSDVTNCVSCSKNGDSEDDSVFDASGNIKGKAPKDNLLATSALSPNNLNNDSNFVKQDVNPVITYLILAFGILAMIYFAKSRLAYSITNSNSASISSNDISVGTRSERLLEINQKTDGTVVIRLKDREYKVCKPELDSESDQFISRIMELMENGEKEIDYDTLLDDKISFNAPLSKLVTRLGFVGIKRDIFFPRTSKTKVMFRKYVTEDDLIAMSLNKEQISFQLQQ
ncbi:MAG TPA: MerR family transcriptional regulator [Candidatus Saccharimonadales bacterium]|nr:MerR family transcriptional regulator [Candidatus Saccharimonadales bacterium]